MWKELFAFTRSERIGIALLVTVILITKTAHWLYVRSNHQEVDQTVLAEHQQAYRSFTESLSTIPKREPRFTNSWNPIVIPVIRPIPFDPNKADSLTLLQVGLRPYQIKNLLKYRAKGGVFRKPTDLKKLYGMDSELFESLASYIVIGANEQPKDTLYAPKATIERDTLKFFKYAEGTLLNLNQVDTVELKKIPLIGSYYASQIVRYRKQLGGFYSVTQLDEIPNLPKDLKRWFQLSDTEIQSPLLINNLSIEALKAHPYLNFYQAKAIVEHRKRKGEITSLEQLKLYEEFTASDLNRLKHYVSFKSAKR